MSNLRKAAVQMLLAFDGQSDIGMEAAAQQLRKEIHIDRKEGRRRTAAWRKAHPRKPKDAPQP